MNIDVALFQLAHGHKISHENWDEYEYIQLDENEDLMFYNGFGHEKWVPNLKDLLSNKWEVLHD